MTTEGSNLPTTKQEYADALIGMQTKEAEGRADYAKRHDIASWPISGMFYVCRWCGYHPNNRATWCGAGCGSDYNHIFKVSSS
jgi:rubrerythrin